MYKDTSVSKSTRTKLHQAPKHGALLKELNAQLQWMDTKMQQLKMFAMLGQHAIIFYISAKLT